MDEHLDSMLAAAGTIETTSKEWSSNVVLARKMDMTDYAVIAAPQPVYVVDPGEVITKFEKSY